MKELVTKLMNHGFSERQAQIFLGECYKEFEKLFAKRHGFNALADAMEIDPDIVISAEKENTAND